MKRLITSVILLILIIGLSIFTLQSLRIHKDNILSRTEEIRGMAQDPDPQALAQKSRELFDEWNKDEEILVLYVRHDILDQITQLLAELPALAEYEDYAAFFGRLDVVSALMDDLWKSNLPTYRNLL